MWYEKPQGRTQFFRFCIDKGDSTDLVVNRRMEVIRLMQEMEKIDNLEVAQKAKIKWAIEGDENSKYYHGVLNKKRSRLTIRGVLADDQKDALESEVTNDEVRKAVWDCGVDKTLGPDGFTQILDGPFILNEIVQWCKKRNKQAMFFKVDFEKAYDSVRWDFVEDILRKFGLGDKWCTWIRSCLQSSRGSVIVNGSPTEEFQFYKGLKQGDQVGDLMSRIQSWSEIIEGIEARLSRWKLKTVSIGGRLTLIKSVLGAINIYHMSVFKVPMQVLQKLESIRARFFNGTYVNSRKPSWVRWKSVMTSKDVGGLGVSSLFALNRALMFKWVWRFISHKTSLWARVISALHGDEGKIDIAFKELAPRIYALESLKGISAKLSHGGLDQSLRRKPKGGAEQVQLELLQDLMHGCMLSNSNDRWSWSLDGGGDFTVSSVRKAIDNRILPKGSTKTRWIKEVPIKINIHAWKVKNDCLPTRFNMSRRGMDIDSILCPMCNSMAESSMHLFFSCNFIRDIMLKINRWWEVDHREIDSYDKWLEWLASIRLPMKVTKVFEGICVIV
nr:RNA-directed DNA polymerase, eukaryota, reverse transcriptase zinc-binding domain protein [Tanacetum cinerariifolium]